MPLIARGGLPQLVISLALGLALLPRAAHADARDACATTAEEAQALKLRGKLVDARTAFLSCSRSECPPIVRRDCESFYQEIDRALPTVVVVARNAEGRDIEAVKVTADGVVITERLDGKAIPIDPGPHVFRFETTGFPAVEEKIVAGEGAKNRSIPVRFGPAPVVPTQTQTNNIDAETPPPRKSTPVLAWVLVGVGAVALGSFAVLAISGQSKFDDCEKSHACSDSEKSSLKTQRTFAWSTLGVGLVAGGVGSAMLLRF